MDNHRYIKQLLVLLLFTSGSITAGLPTLSLLSRKKKSAPVVLPSDQKKKKQKSKSSFAEWLKSVSLLKQLPAVLLSSGKKGTAHAIQFLQTDEGKLMLHYALYLCSFVGAGWYMKIRLDHIEATQTPQPAPQFPAIPSAQEIAGAVQQTLVIPPAGATTADIQNLTATLAQQQTAVNRVENKVTPLKNLIEGIAQIFQRESGKNPRVFRDEAEAIRYIDRRAEINQITDCEVEWGRAELLTIDPQNPQYKLFLPVKILVKRGGMIGSYQAAWEQQKGRLEQLCKRAVGCDVIFGPWAEGQPSIQR